MGSFIIDTLSFYGREKNDVEINYVIPEWQPKNGLVSSFGALSGLRTAASMIPTIKIIQTKFNSNTGKITLNLIIDSKILVEYLYFSYILWMASPSLRVIEFPASNVNSNKHQMMSISEISNNDFVFKGLAFIRDLTPGMTFC